MNMKPGSFLSLFGKLESLVARLPESLQAPILREITPIKTLFLLQRAPRIVLVGERAASKAELIDAIFGSEVMSSADEAMRDGQWHSFSRGGHGTLRVLDARSPVSATLAESALASEEPDLFIFLRRSETIGDDMPAELAHVSGLVAFAVRKSGATPRMLGLQMGGGSKAREELHAALHTQPQLEGRMIGTLALGDDTGEIDRLVQLLGVEFPPEAQLELARLSGNRALQRQIAQVLVKSVTAICGAIGTQPIPLADFPILTSLQATMVAGIMHISGREMSTRLAGEFIAALGANISLGLALREGARAALKFIPLWGNAVSGAVAAAGTYGVGRAATAYFIDGVSMRDARGYFRSRKNRAALPPKNASRSDAENAEV